MCNCSPEVTKMYINKDNYMSLEVFVILHFVIFLPKTTHLLYGIA